jgi:hypothetical protein
MVMFGQPYDDQIFGLLTRSNRSRRGIHKIVKDVCAHICRTRASENGKEELKIPELIDETCYKVGTQFGTQKCAEQAVEAVDAVHAVRILLSKFSAC